MSAVAGPPSPPPVVTFMGVRVADQTRAELVESLADLASDRSGGPTVAFAMHIGGLMALGEDAAFATSMANADIVYADGVSTQLLARLAGAERIERAVTTDVGWELLAALARRSGRLPRVALLGGRPGLAEEAMRRMVEAGAATPTLTAHGYQDDWEATIAGLNEARPDVIFVGMGAPLEMVWVRENLAALPGALTMTCGGWFGYIVGEESRAPMLMRRLYLEWLYRLGLQPRRLAGRYLRGMLRLPVLMAKVVRERLAGRAGRRPASV
jgi:N-acetylglucosaminyldiphosphoundecaprenol N-acetyl-beta-D-mannosaminyltransferase